MADSAGDERTYRRGLVMGLTMAEIMVLLLFVLLLLFGLRLRKDKSNPSAVFPGSTTTLGVLATKAGFPPERIPDDFTNLVLAGMRAAQGAASLGMPVNAESVEQVAKDATLGKALKDGLGSNRVGVKPEEAVRDFLVDATKRYSADSAALGGPGSSPIWLGGLEVRDTGLDGGPRGVFPPCARTPLGKSALVLTTELFDDNIVVSDNDIESMRRTAPAAESLFSQIQRGAALSDSAFLAQTQAVFDWSVAQKCRFYVYVVDRTGAGAKKAYKQRLATVEGHFYKLLGGDDVKSPS